MNVLYIFGKVGLLIKICNKKRQVFISKMRIKYTYVCDNSYQLMFTFFYFKAYLILQFMYFIV